MAEHGIPARHEFDGNDYQATDMISTPATNPSAPCAFVYFSRTYMKQVVAIHQAMFEKLLFDEDAAVRLGLAELFHDAGRTYLQISERINEMCLSWHSLQD
jgi:hypothetical protein